MTAIEPGSDGQASSTATEIDLESIGEDARWAVRQMAGSAPDTMVQAASSTAMGVIAALSVTGNIKRK